MTKKFKDFNIWGWHFLFIIKVVSCLARFKKKWLMEAGLVAKVNLSINKCRNICEGHSLNVADIWIASIPILWPRFLPWAFFIANVVAKFHILTALGNKMVKRNCQVTLFLLRLVSSRNLYSPRRSAVYFLFLFFRTWEVSFNLSFSPGLRQFFQT